MTRTRFGGLEIQQVKSSARFEDTDNFAQGLFPIVAVEVVDHERGEDRIESFCRIFKSIRETLIEAQRHSRLFSFPLCPRERLRIRVEANDLGGWKTTLQQNSKCACSTADIEDMFFPSKMYLTKQHLPGTISTQNLRRDNVTKSPGMSIARPMLRADSFRVGRDFGELPRSQELSRLRLADDLYKWTWLLAKNLDSPLEQAA